MSFFLKSGQRGYLKKFEGNRAQAKKQGALNSLSNNKKTVYVMKGSRKDLIKIAAFRNGRQIYPEKSSKKIKAPAKRKRGRPPQKTVQKGISPRCREALYLSKIWKETGWIGISEIFNIEKKSALIKISNLRKICGERLFPRYKNLGLDGR